MINNNIAGIKLGETICYHIGYLAEDRAKREFLGFKLDEDGQEKITQQGLPIPIHGEPTEEATKINRVAGDLYHRSTASWKDLKCEDLQQGTGEFSLTQKKLSYLNYEYYAKRIK